MPPNPPRDVGEPLYELPHELAPLDGVRGTILALDWRALREAGLYDSYAARLDQGALLTVTPGSWVALDVLVAHYRALDALDLSQDQIRAVGSLVGEGVHGAFLSTLLRLAGKLGVTPWPALEQSYKLWARSWRGGGIMVHRVSDRWANVTLLQTPVCESHFFRESFAGALSAGIAPFCRSPAVDVTTTRPDSVTFRATWQP